MSYDIYLVDPVTAETIEFDLNVTWNYVPYFYRTINNEIGIRKIYGMTAAESIPLLEKAISLLGDEMDNDYWNSTEGNAKRALLQLLALAKMRPDGIWDGD